MCYVPMPPPKKHNKNANMPPPFSGSLFIERLTERMAALRMTNGDLAERAEVSTAAIHYYIQGLRQPKSAELSRLAAALGTSMDWLWGVTDETASPDYHHGLSVYYARQISNMRNRLQSILDSTSDLHKGIGLDISGNGNTISGGVGNTNITITPPSDNPKP